MLIPQFCKNLPARTLSLAIALIMIGVYSITLFRSEHIQRPFSLDEFITLQNYTLAGLQPSGERREIRRITDYEQAPAPGPMQLVMGVYASLGRWTEPNNHVIHSLLCNFTQFVSPKTERLLRMPAFFAGLLFLLLMLFLGHFVLKWRHAHVLLTALVPWLPYLLEFSQKARGYTVSLALQAALLLVVTALLRNPRSITTAALGVLLSVATFMNLVNMAIAWVLPVYAALAWQARSKGERLADSPLWRSVVIQLLVIGLAGGIFLIDRLPAVYSSMRQYGLHFSGIGGLMQHLAAGYAYLFPGVGWTIFSLAGLAGVVAMWRSEQTRVFARIAIVVFAGNLLYFLVSGSMPFYRNLGLILPLVFLGAGHLFDMLLSRTARRIREWAVAAAVIVPAGAFFAFAATDSISQDRKETRFTDPLVSWAEALPPADGSLRMIFYPEDVWGLLHKYLPAHWLGPDDRLRPAEKSSLYVFMNQGALPELRVAQKKRTWDPTLWPEARRDTTLGRWRQVELPGRVLAFSGEGMKAVPDAQHMLAFWYPARENLYFDASAVRAFAAATELPHSITTTRFQVKLDVYGVLHSVFFAAGSPQQVALLKRALKNGLARFGGEAFVFLPSETKD